MAGLGATPPADVVEAEQIILKQQWESRLGGGTGSTPEALVTIAGATYAIPNRAAALLAPRALDAYL